MKKDEPQIGFEAESKKIIVGFLLVAMACIMSLAKTQLAKTYHKKPPETKTVLLAIMHHF